ncbi:kinase-like domain-containing protein [Microdochium trichocladiopsis]|uniref:Kinase-like domain-containing protein n=1 Tax=Microdochium trichocladiopsis TaxID=1682393 RepID=A0A9P8YGH1_9PEZI|nr:kinase-like domain-containing protein [Microdochium trichocladiopsis]KAH7037650.1 kinase-like domain-containing protein [Microdochium trichocladiopsis]
MQAASSPGTPSPPLAGTEARQWSFHSMPSPRIAVHDDATVSPGFERPPLAPHLSAPPGPQYQSPLRQHKRTPSQHREIKETLNARTQYTSDETEGTQHRINQYVIRQEIGRGSYGAVHLATDQFGQEYAVKEFSKTRLRKRIQSNILRRPDMTAGGSAGPGPGRLMAQRRQFQSQKAAEIKDALYLIREETAIMKKLNHPNLVALIEVLDDPEEDSLYMVLEMCHKGVVMKVGLDEDAEPYSEDMCRTWFRDLILGIEYLHAQGVVHRDIKPDNLLLAADDCLKIVDFGVSEMFEKPDLMVTKKSAGSPAFLPPELCVARHGDVSGTAADIWSMGVSLYCLRYGKLPFNKPGVLEMYEAIRNDEVPIPSDEGPLFADLMSKVLNKDPDTRITMTELREHPWVTNEGSDPLLSKEENCATLIEAPDEMEVNHAFTRKMSHMFYVMRAIHRFKCLISKSKASTPEPTTSRTFSSLGLPSRIVLPGVEKMKSLASGVLPTPQLLSPLSLSTPSDNNNNLNDNTTSGGKTVAEEAAELVRQRRAFLASQEGASQAALSLPPAAAGTDTSVRTPHQPKWPPPGLGIHTDLDDGHETLIHGDASAQQQQFVSDSPTGIDFEDLHGESIYDRAFSAEIKRIRSQKHKERSKTYLTRLLGAKEVEKWAADDCMIVEAGRSLAAKVGAIGGDGSGKVSFGSRNTGGHGVGGAAAAAGGDMRDLLASRLTTARRDIQEGAAKVDGIAREQGMKFADLVAQMTKSKQAGAGIGAEIETQQAREP